MQTTTLQPTPHMREEWKWAAGVCASTLCPQRFTPVSNYETFALKYVKYGPNYTQTKQISSVKINNIVFFVSIEHDVQKFAVQVENVCELLGYQHQKKLIRARAYQNWRPINET